MNKYAKYLVFKSSMESILGSEAWYALKESNYLPTWKKYAEKLFKTLLFSIEDTVEIHDPEWLEEIKQNIDRGYRSIKTAKEIDEVIAVIAGTLISVSFLQVGQMPMRTGNPKKVTLRKGKWQLNAYRSVVYLQTKEQKENYFLNRQRRKLGFEQHQELLSEYHASKSKLSYIEWCNEHKKT